MGRPGLGDYLFTGTCAVAALLLAAVFLSPLAPGPAGDGRVLGLFAHDATLRRTCLAGAAGLVVSAFVFFRPAPPPGGA